MQSLRHTEDQGKQGRAAPPRPQELDASLRRGGRSVLPGRNRGSYPRALAAPTFYVGAAVESAYPVGEAAAARSKEGPADGPAPRTVRSGNSAVIVAGVGERLRGSYQIGGEC